MLRLGWYPLTGWMHLCIYARIVCGMWCTSLCRSGMVVGSPRAMLLSMCEYAWARVTGCVLWVGFMMWWLCRCMVFGNLVSLRRIVRHLGLRLLVICWLHTSGVGSYDIMIAYSLKFIR